MIEIFERAKKRAESSTIDTRESFTIGCHSNNDILSLAHTLKAMKEQVPNLYPIFRVVPFQHLYQRLSEEAVDAVVAFREGGLKKAIHYQELTKIPVVGIAKAHCFFDRKSELQLCDLKQGSLIVLAPPKCPEEYRKLLDRVLEDRSPTDVYFCDAVEAAITLAQAGYGVAMLPDFFQDRQPSLRYFPIIDATSISYGVYYKALAGHPLRKTFVNLAKESFSMMSLS